jgi:hypothetical protein
MNPLSEVATQCLSVKKVLARLRRCIRDESYQDALAAAIRTLDVFELELRVFVQFQSYGGELHKLPPDRLADVGRLRLELLAEALQDALRKPLPRQVRQPLLCYQSNYAALKPGLEAVLLSVAEKSGKRMLHEVTFSPGQHAPAQPGA